MTHENGMMKMRQVDAIELPAGQAVNLGASGYHLMLMGLKQPLQAGEHDTLTLKVRTADGQERKVAVNAEVKPLNAAKPAHDMGGMHHHH
jgi:copper(I)-binding protein